MTPIDLRGFARIVFFTGAGMSADQEQGPLRHRQCPQCGAWLRPARDTVSERSEVGAGAGRLVEQTDLFVSVGTSGAVWPAAGFAQQARRSGARMVEINPEDNEASSLYETRIRAAASSVIPRLFPLPDR